MPPSLDKNSFKYVYGPVWSWRLGVSLGIDPVSAKDKICNYDCTYCQLGPTLKYYTKRELFVRKKDLAGELGRIGFMSKIDTLTFSGRGEPTLAKNLGELIRVARDFNPKRIAVITNGALFSKKDVCQDVSLSDIVIVKIDAGDQNIFNTIDKPAKGITWSRVSKAIRKFRDIYEGTMSIRVMFIKDNLDHAAQIAESLKDLGADEIEIDTPLRKCPEKPVARKELEQVIPYFKDICDRIYSVYSANQKPWDIPQVGQSRKRHGLVRPQQIV